MEKFSVFVLIVSGFHYVDRIQLHFENIQRIADTTTLPHAMPHLSCRIAEDLNLSHLMERLVKEKDQPNSLSSLEKLELWDSLKILSMKVVAFCFLWIYKLQVLMACC